MTGHYTLRTSSASLSVSSETLRLVSFTAAGAPDQEFIAADPTHPVFVIQYLDQHHHYQQISSSDARIGQVTRTEEAYRTELTLAYSGVGGLDIDVVITVAASPDDPACRWGISLRNNAEICITDVQYPFVVCRYNLQGKTGTESILLPSDYGRLIREPSPTTLEPDSSLVWQLQPHNGAFNHYPGGQFAQFLAYYNDRAGLYMACEDDQGNIKRFGAFHRDPGFHLGVTHIGDWPQKGERRLEYDTVMSGFVGDWYAAAETYRTWSLVQKWGTPLHKRDDVPEWLLDSPPYITIRPQGYLDSGPVEPVAEFLPLKKCIPLLENVAARVEAPIVSVIMGWERAGSWVYPDCFPPIGGDASVSEFARLSRKRGWRVGSFCNGTRWVVGHCWNDYNGWDYFEENGGGESVCRLPDGSMWQDVWDRRWRPSFVCCLGADLTRNIANSFVERLVGWGLESIQFFDQNCGATTFPCFSEDHGHPPVPGKWMTEAMIGQMSEFREVDGHNPEVIHSTEMACNEYCLQHFQQSDSRLCPPGHRVDDNIVPVYQFLYHECIVMHGGMGHAPEPYHMQIRNAYNGVMGEIPGGVLTGDGTFLDKDTINWADWLPKVGDNDQALEMIRVVTALRRGPGKDYLVYGRMLRPASVEGVETVMWDHDGKHNEIPAVFHAAWMAPDGTNAVALSNWTAETRTVTLQHQSFGSQATIVTSARGLSTVIQKGNSLDIELFPLSMALVTNREPDLKS